MQHMRLMNYKQAAINDDGEYNNDVLYENRDVSVPSSTSTSST